MISKTDIHFVRSLSDKNFRAERNLFVVEGEKMVRELLKTNLKIARLFCMSGCCEIDAGIEEIVTTKEMERMSTFKTPSDCLAVVEMPSYDRPQIDNENLILALDFIQDPGNVGTIIRLADWFGISDIICSHDSADCFNPKVIQATMGAIFRVRVHYCNLVETLRGVDVNIYGTTLSGEDIYKEKLTRGGVILMGNESRGVSKDVLPLLTNELFIPPYPADRRGSESLNVATATAIVCAEFRKRI